MAKYINDKGFEKNIEDLLNSDDFENQVTR